MRPLLVVTHLLVRDLGLIEQAAGSGHPPLQVVERLHGDRLPAIEDICGIVTLGGQMSVTRIDDDPLLQEEASLLREAIGRELPVLGVCLGAQLVAHAAGGSVTRLPELFAGWPSARTRDDLDEDPVFADVPDDQPVLEWHRDAIVPPPDAVILAETSGPGCSLFRVGPCAWGSQPHIDATSESLEHWICDPVDNAALLEGGLDPEQLRRGGDRHLAAQIDVMRPRLEAFLRLAASRGANGG